MTLPEPTLRYIDAHLADHRKQLRSGAKLPAQTESSVRRAAKRRRVALTSFKPTRL